MAKTLVFVGLAVVAGGLAFATRTGPVGVAAPDEVGRLLFDKFKDPLTAKSLKIVRFNEDLANLSEIEIKEVDGIWTLPSHSGYPADAENKVRDAATPFVDMKIIAVASDSDGDHAMYGVVEPGTDKSAVGDQGVGTLVNIKDATGGNLVDLIIGKEYQEGQHYVRPTKISRVYIAEVDPATLPVRFDDWIEKDLLNVSSFDIDAMTLKDYTFDVAQTLRGPITQFDQRFEMKVSDDSGKWKLDSLLEARDNQLVPTELLEGEELNQERLNGMKEALDNLEIVDIERKPSGLGEDLKADKGFFNDQASVDSLVDKGIYPVELNGAVELLSTEGEVLVDTKDGVQYVLRFGRVAGVDTDAIDSGLNRYLLVSARVNDDHFPELELEQLPSLPPTLPATENSSADETPSEAANPDDDAEETVIESETETSDDDAETSDDDAETSDDDAETSDDEAGVPEDVSTDEESVEDDGLQEETVAEVDEEEATATEEGDETESAEVDLQAERERITKENQRKIDERKDEIKAAEDKVRELNYRFADWYYVISEDVYKKIHLGRADIIKETEDAKESGFDVDAFRNLEDGGLPNGNDLQLPGSLQPSSTSESNP